MRSVPVTQGPGTAKATTPLIPKRKRFWQYPYVQVLSAMAAGVVLGWLDPWLAAQMKPLADAFISLIKMVIGPIVFLIVITGVARVGDISKIGRIGAKALVYFELITTLGLLLGIAVADIVQPGVGVRPLSGASAKQELASYVGQSQNFSVVDFFSKLIPDNIVNAFAKGNLIQILIIAILGGVALILCGDRARPIEDFCERLTDAFFGVINIIMRAAPIAAFGAMAFTVGKFGTSTLWALGKLILCSYVAMAIFAFVVLGAVCWLCGLNLLRLISFIREELLIVLATSSSESVLPMLMEKLERFGISRPVVGLVIPASYSFNLDGIAITLPISVLFIAQVYGISLSSHQQIGIFTLMLLTSKGAAGVTGAAFAALAATVTATALIPVEGLALLLGIDRIMSQGRAITNVIGNVVATVAVAKWEGEFDVARAREAYKSTPLATEA